MRNSSTKILAAAALTCLVAALFCAGREAPAQKKVDPNLECHLKATVLVETEVGYGSGVVVVRGERCFVWTDAHVVESEKKVENVVDKNGRAVVRVTFKDVLAVTQEEEGGRKVSSTSYLAKIVRYSERHDVALLQVYKKRAFKEGVSFSAVLPRQGEEVWSVGSSGGPQGFNSVVKGTVSGVGRLRKDSKVNDAEGLIVDQINFSCMGGASGSGLFDVETGKCIGLVTEHIHVLRHTINFITPARRLREFAVEADCLWAFDADKEVPADEVIWKGPIAQDDLPAPKTGWGWWSRN